MTRWSWRAVFYGAFLISCAVTIWPPLERNGTPGKLKLGLDLRGGAHLVLQVLPDGAMAGSPSRVTPDTLKEVIRTLERRVNQLGVADPVITEYGSTGDRVLVQLPGVEDVEKAKRLIISVAQLSVHLVDRVAPTRESLLAQLADGVPPGLMALEGRAEAPGETAVYLVRRQPVVTGRDLKNARAGLGELGEPNVRFTLKPPGAEAFERETAGSIGRRLAIVFDDRVISAPMIEGAVGMEGQIRGGFTAAEADELATLLRAGALPAKMRYLDQLTVGASLGRDSIRAGLIASGAALLFIAVFMLAYYRLAGANAVVALLANLLMLLAAMVWLDATLTLPGIAGVILTLGVGVDTNVLVFERIREELRQGKAARQAMRNGFARAWVTILDTHATALIAAAFLFQFGTGSVKGYAVTVVIGLLANVFASYFASKLLFEWALRDGRAATLSI
jgi:preprotein translocase subunit SecD